MNKAVFGKTVKNVGKNRDSRIILTAIRGIYSVGDPKDFQNIY